MTNLCQIHLRTTGPCAQALHCVFDSSAEASPDSLFQPASYHRETIPALCDARHLSSISSLPWRLSDGDASRRLLPLKTRDGLSAIDTTLCAISPSLPGLTASQPDRDDFLSCSIGCRQLQLQPLCIKICNPGTSIGGGISSQPYLRVHKTSAHTHTRTRNS